MKKGRTSTNAGINYNPIRFDIMINDKFYHTITIFHKDFAYLDEDMVREEVIKRLPTLKNRGFKVVLS